MNSKAAKLVLEVGILVFFFLLTVPLRAQVASAILSGTVTDPSGKVLTDAKVSVKNIVTGQSTETRTDFGRRLQRFKPCARRLRGFSFGGRVPHQCS